MSFHNPTYLLLLLALIPLIIWYILRQSKSEADFQISGLQLIDKIPVSKKIYLRHLPFVLRLLAITLIVIVIARPQSSNSWQDQTTEGIDIIIAEDISGSMLAKDLKPNRLKAAKNVAIDFIQGRPNDNIGLVVFAGESFTQCPLTTDHDVLINLFNSVDFGMIEDGTAIGSGLANAISRIKDSKAKSKVIILLTDGSNNAGDIAPETAAEIARNFGIRVYTIGIGTHGTAPYPVMTPFGIQYQNQEVVIDEDILKSIAQVTGGSYFRATDNRKLEAIYQQIDAMEKTKIEVKEFSKKNEMYFIFALLALILIIAEIVLRNTLLRKIP
ncbi:MAG: VWA domain-containing protein [Paludibacteraceae bacterium]|nr:VWA domain-containing protein [Paludibacteraceae bacterium]